MAEVEAFQEELPELSLPVHPCNTNELEETLSEFSSPLNEVELFKYFLNDDYASANGESQFLSPSSPPSSLEGSPLASPVFSGSESPLHGSESAYIPIKEEKGDNNTTPRKRKDESGCNKGGLSREELLQLSSKGLEVYAQNLASTHPLSPDEERNLKRQRRLVKNRESAQLSRLRKKIYIEELEKKVNHLATENETLSKQLASISAEKKKLHDEVIYLQTIIKRSPELSQLALNGKKNLALGGTAITHKNVKAAGICLLIVLFSFGLLFNSSNENIGLPIGQSREDSPEVIPKAVAASKKFSTARVLNNVEQAVDVVSSPSAESAARDSIKEDSTKYLLELIPNRKIDNKDSEILAVSKKAKEKSKKSPMDDLVPEKGVEVVSGTSKKRMKIADEPISDSKSLVPHNGTYSYSLAIAGSAPGTSYIYCPEAQHVTHITSNNQRPDPKVIALLIPSSVLYGEGIDNSLLEVSCSVLNLNLWSLANSTA